VAEKWGPITVRVLLLVLRLKIQKRSYLGFSIQIFKAIMAIISKYS
jgi:hypothetical protein